jgi:hypothetical protein
VRLHEFCGGGTGVRLWSNYGEVGFFVWVQVLCPLFPGMAYLKINITQENLIMMPLYIVAHKKLTIGKIRLRNSGKPGIKLKEIILLIYQQ